MKTLQSILLSYSKVERPILQVIGAQFCFQAINTSFFLLLNFVMAHRGFSDPAIAEVWSFRFLAVFWMAFPLGLFIKGKRLIPLLLVAAIGLPLFSHLILWAIEARAMNWLYLFAGLWGVCYTFAQVSILPFIVLNASKETQSEAISLNFLAFSVMMFLSGVLHFSLNHLDPETFDEATTLRIISALSLVSVFLLLRIRITEKRGKPVPLQGIRKGYDWKLIAKALTPTFLIAIGAGFTIPVINLFFLYVHGMPSGKFSVMGSVTFLLVAMTMFFMPFIRKNFGYRIAITLFQTSAVIALVGLASTAWYSDWWGAIWLAGFFYVVRQPLMTSARPMTSELMLKYVGPKNQELISAMSASIWSGSWFVSTRLFGWLREIGMEYGPIFMITVAFYAAGVAWYAGLIRSFEGRKPEEKVRRRARRRVEEGVTG